MSQVLPPMWCGVPVAEAQVICVFVHGRGQTPEDMDDAVLRRLSATQVAFCLPRAENRSWYTARAIDPLTKITKAEMAAAFEHLESIVVEIRKRAPGVPMVVAGFSQGACLALEWICAGGTAPDALVAFTGCRVGTISDNQPSTTLHGLPIYLTGGDADPWIPVAAFADAVKSLAVSGTNLRADVFPNRSHEVSPPEIAMLDLVLRELAAGAQVTFGAAR